MHFFLVVILIVQSAVTLAQNKTNFNDLVQEGDMVNFDPNVFSEPSFKSGLFWKSFLWPNSTFFYVLDRNFSNNVLKVLRKAMNHIEERSCIRFVELNETENDTLRYYAIQKSQKISQCTSTVAFICTDGTSNCEHGMWVGEQCPFGSLVHELMHALGFVHEQSRDDRDQFVTIHWDNIMDPVFDPVNNKMDNMSINFEKYLYPLRYDTPYDYGSIMHYHPYAFSKDQSALRTVEPNDKLLPEEIGQRKALSPLDMEKLKKAYCPNDETNYSKYHTTPPLEDETDFLK